MSPLRAPPIPAPSQRPTLRALAALAGVSAMTVSLALRNHPSISARTRRRLQKLAAAEGYAPDPVVAKLMHHLRTRRVHRVQSALGGLYLRLQEGRPAPPYEYQTAVLNGARARAEVLGFRLETMAIDDGLSPRRLQQILLNRGIEGLILLPMRVPVSLAGLLDWSRFAVVAATSSVTAPVVNAAMPDQFGNMLLLCRALAERGGRRIGLVTLAEHDVRVNHRVMAAHTWHCSFGGGTPIPPLVIPPGPPNQAAVRGWIRAHRPDAVICDSEGNLDAIIALAEPRSRRQIDWATTSVNASGPRYPGINNQPEEVGSAAVEMLAGMIQRGQIGLPGVPRTTLIAGEFQARRERR